MEWGEGRAMEGSQQRQVQALAKSSIQHLYQLLGKNAKDGSESNPLISMDRRFQLHRPQEGIRINLDYSRAPTEEKQVSPTRKIAILEGFHKKTRNHCNHKKKTFSVEVSNTKLKDLILGKRQEKKVSFFDATQTEPHRNILFHKQESSIEASKEASREAFKRYPTDCDQKAEPGTDGDLNHHFQRVKESLKLKPIEYYIRKAKNSKFSIMGFSMKKHKKRGKETIEIKQSLTSELQLAIVSNADEKIISQWKIDSIPMKFGDQKRKFNATNAAKLVKKNSIETLITKCLPYLMISEHILWKLEQMLKFYALVLYSFQCCPLMIDSASLPKYNRKHVKYTYFVGGGNNRGLIAQLMEKRWWWRETSDLAEANLVWTQQKLKIQQVTLQELESNSNNSIPEQKIQKSKLSKIKKRFYLLQQEQKCKNLFESFQFNNKQIQTGDLQIISTPSIIYNHMAGGKYLGNKKSLFLMLKIWFEAYKGKPQLLFSFIPETYHVENSNCEGFQSFLHAWNQYESKQSGNLWIIKPGENSNRGRGIFLSSQLKDITESTQNRSVQGGTTIIQKYMSNLLFYHGRKFDIRTYLLCVTIGASCKYYWYDEGYLRTSSHPFSLKVLSTMTHLTNDAIQSQGDQYGKYEKGNKLSYAQFQSYLDEISSNYKMTDLRIAMKRIAKTIAAASSPIINAEKNTGFELFGMDFIVDSSFKPWLLEVNTNPCLEQSCPLLQKLIPNVVQNVFRLSIDPVFPPTVLPNKESEYTMPEKMMEWNKFELIFDSKSEGDQEWSTILSKTWEGSKQAKDINSSIQ